MKSPNAEISIIIPVLNEETTIPQLLAHLAANNSGYIKEVIVVDGGSSDQTIKKAEEGGATIVLSGSGRAKQMNTGAQKASGDILYFLHADTFPPTNFDKAIVTAFKKGITAGCFRMKFDSKSLFLRFFSWFSRINLPICRGGDQSLFIEKNLFFELEGFDEQYLIYEDSEFISRLYKKTSFAILPKYVLTSARKYEKNGIYRLQFHFGIIHLKNYMGAKPEALFNYYRRHILN